MTTKTLLTGILGLSLGLGFTTPSWAAPAVVEKGTAHFAVEADFPIDVLGEDVHLSWSVSYNYHVVTTPGGDTVYHELWLNPSATLTAESGTVWTLKKTVSPFINRSTGGGMTQFTERSTYVSDTGQILELRNKFQISFNANGELKIDRFEVRCWVRD